MDKKVQKLLIQYRNTVEELREIGVIRTGKVVPDYGEYIASKKLNLTLATGASNKGFDAVDKDGKKYEIKTRKATAWNKPNIFPVNPEQLKTSDFLVYVEFDNDWNLVKLLKIPTKNVEHNKHKRVIITKKLVEEYSIL